MKVLSCIGWVASKGPPSESVVAVAVNMMTYNSAAVQPHTDQTGGIIFTHVKQQQEITAERESLRRQPAHRDKLVLDLATERATAPCVLRAPV